MHRNNDQGAVVMRRAALDGSGTTVLCGAAIGGHAFIDPGAMANGVVICPQP